MKKLSFFAILLASLCSFSQEYNFKKVGAENYSFDMAGKIVIKDSLITIESDSHKASRYPVIKNIENDTLKKFTSKLEGLNANFTLNTKQKTFVYEFKSMQSKEDTKMTYYLD